MYNSSDITTVEEAIPPATMGQGDNNDNVSTNLTSFTLLETLGATKPLSGGRQ